MKSAALERYSRVVASLLAWRVAGRVPCKGDKRACNEFLTGEKRGGGGKEGRPLALTGAL